nr:uncharacterized protein LOC127349232 [Lolium perenne]
MRAALTLPGAKREPNGTGVFLPLGRPVSPWSPEENRFVYPRPPRSSVQPKAQMIQHSYCFMGYFSYLDESVCSPSSILYESVCSYIIAALLQQLQEPHASL